MASALPVNVPHHEEPPAPTSKMRSHKGNQPVLPQDKQCPHCSAKFTRTTHLNRHMRNHTKEGLHSCDLCGAEFTRSDLLSRHHKTCAEKQGSARRKSCLACTESKVKCDREIPCSKCRVKNKECIYPTTRRRASRITNQEQQQLPQPGPTLPPIMPHHPVASHHTSGHGFLPPAIHAGPSIPIDPALTGGAPESVYSSVLDDPTGSVGMNPALTSRYQTDVFQPFFSTLFGNSEPTQSEQSTPPGSLSESFPFSTDMLSPQNAFASGSRPPYSFSSDFQPGRSLEAPLSNIRGSPSSSSGSVSSESRTNPEIDYYVHLFWTEFQKQMPLAHEGTFKHEVKIPILLSTMAACGALFVRTRAASDFITKTIGESKAGLLQEFGKNTTNISEQVQLLLAVVLLQTLGLYHQTSAERSSSHIYHGMMVMMIRRAGLIDKTSMWQPEIPNPTNLDQCWRSWAFHEMVKRCLWLSYCHDTTHTIFFALASSYAPDELNTLKLPCEDRLFMTKTAGEWYLSLQNSSQYGSVQYRLLGLPMADAYGGLTSKEATGDFSPIPPFAHFVLVHRILRRLFEIGTEASRLPGNNHSDEMFSVQYQLHNWLQSWLRSPDIPRVKEDQPREEPNFLQNALPFYWLGQVAILAFQDGYPPFTSACPTNRDTEARFRLIKRWMKQIRQWLNSSDEAPTLFWDDLMKFRLKAWQATPLKEDQYQGMVSWFPEKP